MSELDTIMSEGKVMDIICTTTGWLSFGVGICAAAGFTKYGIEAAYEGPYVAMQEYMREIKVTSSVLGASAGFIVAACGVVLATSNPEN